MQVLVSASGEEHLKQDERRKAVQLTDVNDVHCMASRTFSTDVLTAICQPHIPPQVMQESAGSWKLTQPFSW